MVIDIKNMICNCIRIIVSIVPDDSRLGVISFSDTPSTLCPIRRLNISERIHLAADIHRLQHKTGTDIHSAFQLSAQVRIFFFTFFGKLWPNPEILTFFYKKKTI